ncbi:MAG: DUF3597 domain-containing protein [Bacteroidota bacterium]
MGIFSNIMSKLGLGHHDQAATAANAPAGQPAATPQPTAERAPTPAPGSTPASGPAAISQVDVVAKLESLAAAHSEKLNWKSSIVDLMKLLGLDSSLAARKELASELGCPAEKMGDSAQMNIWLHKTVLQKLAANGGNIPPELL